ncbi:hypothetical protein QTP88_005059 [Uroleucon formosanum]
MLKLFEIWCAVMYKKAHIKFYYRIRKRIRRIRNSGNIISENYKQTELLSQQLRLLPKTTLSQYSETSKTFEHSDLPHIVNIVNIVDETDFNYFIKPRGKQNIQRFFSFYPQHSEKK